MALPDITKGDLSPVYLFLGEEEGEKERFISIIAKRFLPKNTSPDGRTIAFFHAQNGETIQAADFALSSSMFDPCKICVLTNIDKVPLKQDQVMISELIRDLPDSTLLIFSSGENQPPKYFSDAMMSSVQPIVFWRLFENELQAHVSQVFKEKGRMIETGAVRRIISLTGRDLKKVNEAIDRIMTGTEETPVSEKTVISLIADEKEISIFELIDAILKKRKESVSLLKKVLDEGAAELQILALLEREAKRVELYHELRSHGMTHDDAFGELHINPKAVDDFSAYIRLFPEDEIRRLMILLSKADYAGKSSFSSSSLISNTIVDLIASIVLS